MPPAKAWHSPLFLVLFIKKKYTSTWEYKPEKNQK
jgi:hypothetical protein